MQQRRKVLVKDGWSHSRCQKPNSADLWAFSGHATPQANRSWLVALPPYDLGSSRVAAHGEEVSLARAGVYSIWFFYTCLECACHLSLAWFVNIPSIGVYLGAFPFTDLAHLFIRSHVQCDRYPWYLFLLYEGVFAETALASPISYHVAAKVADNYHKQLCLNAGGRDKCQPLLDIVFQNRKRPHSTTYAAVISIDAVANSAELARQCSWPGCCLAGQCSACFSNPPTSMRSS